MKEIPNMPLLMTMFNRHLQDDLNTYCEANLISNSIAFNITITIRNDIKDQIPALKWWAGLHYKERETFIPDFISRELTEEIFLIPGDEVKFYYEKIALAATKITDKVFKIKQLHEEVLKIASQNLQNTCLQSTPKIK